MSDQVSLLPEIFGSLFGLTTAHWIVRKLLQGRRDVVLVVMLVLVALTVPPMVFDLLLGVPDLSHFQGFDISAKDAETRIIYVLYVSAAPWIMYGFGRSRERDSPSLQGTKLLSRKSLIREWLAPVGLIAVYAPLVMLFFVPSPGLYSTYGAALEFGAGSAASESHARLAIFCRMGLVGGAMFLLAIRRLRAHHFVAILPGVLACLWLVGKRGDVAIAIVLLMVVVWQRRTLSGKGIVALGCLATITFLAFSSVYQSGTRVDRLGQSSVDSYTSNRIDFGRDSQIRMSIYANSNPETMQILQYPGQSYLFYATLPIPRSIWAEKPLPYAQYFTSAMFLQPPKLWGWGMTTSWIEESISNLGWLGFIFGPASLGLFCRAGERAGEGLRLVTMLVGSMLLALHLVAIMPVVAVWVLLYIGSKWNRFIGASSSSISGSIDTGVRPYKVPGATANRLLN